MKGERKMRSRRTFFATKAHGGFFFKYFLSYLLVFLIPLALAAFTYASSARIISLQCSNQARSLLSQTKTMTDSRLREMKSISLALKANETLQTFRDTWEESSLGGSRIFQAYKACRALPKYDLVNTAVENVTVYYPGYDVSCFLVSPGNAVGYYGEEKTVLLDGNEISCGQLYRYLTENSFYDQFVFFGGSSSGISFMENDTGVSQSGSPVYFLTKMDDAHRSALSPVILIRIADSFFSDMLSNMMLDNYGVSFIVDGKGELIASYCGKASERPDAQTLSRLLLAAAEEEGSFSFEGNQVNFIRSDYIDWTYYSLIPETVITKDLIAVRNVITVVAAVVILVGLFLCYLLTKRNSKPLKRVIRSLTAVYDYGRFDSENDFTFIENAVTALVDSNSAFREQEKSRRKILDGEVLRRLFLGEGVDSPPFSGALRESSVRLEDHRFVTGYAHVHGLNGKGGFLSESSFLSFLRDLFPLRQNAVYPLVIDEGNLVFLAVCGNEGGVDRFCEELALRLEDLGRRMEREMGYHLDFFLSEPLHRPENVQTGYRQCKDLALRVVKNGERYVYTAADLPPFQQIYRYAIDQELRLAQILQYGSPEELRLFLDELYEQNLQKLSLSDGMKRSFFAAVQSSAIRSLSSLQMEEKAGALLCVRDEPSSREELTGFLLALQGAVRQSLRSGAARESEEKKRAVLAYVQDHYGDSGLNVYSVCRDLQCTEPSLNKFLHDALGLSFSDLLEKTRMEAACSLLRRGDLTVKAVSEQTGYASDASFRRAFKRVLGVSPSEYVKSHGGKAKEEDPL